MSFSQTLLRPKRRGPVTSYANSGGTGDRRAIITPSTSFANTGVGGRDITNWVDGVTNLAATSWNNADDVEGNYIQFRFLDALRYMTEARITQIGLLDQQGTWIWQGSNDGTNWTNISPSPEGYGDGSSNPYVWTSLAGNVAAYSYYRILGQSASGNLSTNPYVTEWEFKVSS